MCDNDAIGVLAGEAGDYWYCADHSPAANLMRSEPIPPQPHVRVVCAGCGETWWADEECLCYCEPGQPDYENWAVVGPEPFMRRLHG